jgi:hypothetical protein
MPVEESLRKLTFRLTMMLCADATVAIRSNATAASETLKHLNIPNSPPSAAQHSKTNQSSRLIIAISISEPPRAVRGRCSQAKPSA